MSNDAPQKTERLISAVLEDGTIVETIHRPKLGQTAFVTWRDGDLREAPTLDLPRRGRVVPYSPENNLLSHGVVLFPSGCEEYGDVESLVADVRAFIHRYADLSEGFEEIASYYILLTWVFDAVPELGYLRFQGDFGSGKSRCLQTVGSLCYKPMFVSGASTVSPMFRIIDAFRGTLVLDESDFRFSDEKAEIIKILNNGNAAGFPVLRSEATPTKEFNPRAFAVFGPKVIASRTLFDDRALESRCITEVMTGMPPRADIPLSLPTAFHEEAASLRNRLLRYRFEHLHTARDLGADRIATVEPRIAQIFAPLLSVVQNPIARERIVGYAERQSGILKGEREVSTEANLLGIIADMRREGSPLIVKDIADRFAERFGGEYARPITPRWVGGQLRRRLSLVPLKSHGTFSLGGVTDEKLETLFSRYGVGDDRVDVGTSETSVPDTAGGGIDF